MSPAAAPVVAEESREPVLKFAAAKSLGYRRRMAWVLGLVAAGFVLQVAFLSVLPGVPLLAAAAVLSWVVGFDNRLDRRGLVHDSKWESVPFERVAEILRLDDAMRRWDSSATDVSSGVGFATWFLAAVLVAALTAFAGLAAGVDVALIVLVDGAVLLLLQWFSGMRTIHRRPELVLKARHLADVVAAARESIDAAGELRGQLLLGRAGARPSPVDARLVVMIEPDPARLLLVQGQVVLNRVQGTPYPYFYAVVVARGGRGLIETAREVGAPGGLVLEEKTEGDVDIAVLRQQTTRTSGYHTKPGVSALILEEALALARRLA